MPDDLRPSALLRRAAERLAAAGVPSPRVDAEVLLAHALGVERAELRRLAILDSPLPDDGTAAAFAALVARRATREPVQHLTGTAPFRHLELAVGPGVFVPRPETEEVAQVAVDEAARVVAERGSAVVVDLCTGTGAIALAVATEVPGARVHAVELDAAAHAWARRNVDAVSRASGAREPLVTLVRGDARTALHDLDGTVDVVVSNPPYVPPDAVPRDPEVAVHDPGVALYGLGPDGLEVPRGVTAAAARLLRPGGLYAMEHAEVQDAPARAMVDATPDPAVGPGSRAFEAAATLPDLTGRPRMVVARRAVHSTT
ncbi:peptide chain release factor N(5)-glutamine methyltransferase [Isoptericola variabilis]|uniref:peptide chain release factor N(5)-glutamine methyltransferase n=1 Tax=Isoptericola variabilis (strain 225) TaxID=743718 RepID=F6FRH1_ISOV2|nr:peptide chain release factor N(5)-glutamine methyltransferase [Isoptericola variabilis]AEG45029.1 protein-(glutamine-N5) methyltransferase, release factor-specific [Isoptericola variabilis 225]TWH26155.1 release factor glutamine methyltransferase [Isoptericola variabilis J7]